MSALRRCSEEQCKREGERERANVGRVEQVRVTASTTIKMFLAHEEVYFSFLQQKYIVPAFPYLKRWSGVDF